MKNKKFSGYIFALIAACCYAISSPFSKLLLAYMPSTLMAGFLYLGAGLFMGVLLIIFRLLNIKFEAERFDKSDTLYIILMVVLDIAAPILLLFGLKELSASNVSLLNNFEIVLTAIIALVIFKEPISGRTWIAILLITVAVFFLCFDGLNDFEFSPASLFVLGATLCWGLENNCTKKLSNKDPFKIVLIKGFFSGTGSLLIGLIIGERLSVIWPIFAVLGLGAVAYGLSILFYIYAQRHIGAALTSSFYSVNPFIGSLLGFLIFKNALSWNYFVGLWFMAIGAFFALPIEKKKKPKIETE